MTGSPEKGNLPYYKGGQPPTPRDLTLCRQKHKTRAVQNTLPHASVTRFGAQVVSQQSPILQTGKGMVSKTGKITSEQLLKIKNWITFDRIIHPKVTLKLNRKLSLHRGPLYSIPPENNNWRQTLLWGRESQ